jgi:predicted metal-dependent hydrolase
MSRASSRTDDLKSPAPAEPLDLTPFTVTIVRSAKRRRTVGAQLRGDVLTVTVPSWMSRADEQMWADKMAASFRRKMSTERIDLAGRAATLAHRYGLPLPREIKWADNMSTRWGSCTFDTATIRIATAVARFPDWVIDAVLVHELCHLEVHGHGPEFWDRANRYPKMERAIGYLIAKSGDHDHGFDD